jgi:aspartyl-tRNA(Asn)/glutamyl-tRNA(Gln) amidotransferase subunit C
MKIGPNEVEYVAKLANLAITEEEKNTFIGQLNSILEYVEQLNSVDTSRSNPRLKWFTQSQHKSMK